MKHIFGCDIDNISDKQTALTIGNFDGLHIGHRKLIDIVKEYACKFDLVSVVFSFNPHPNSILKGDKNFSMITSPEERLYLLERIGIDIFIEYTFDEMFSQMEPEYFLEELLIKKLKCKVIVIGEGNRFGKEHKGSYETLVKLGKKHDVIVVGVPHEKYGGEKISSSAIRGFIKEKNFDAIEKYLTIPYFVMGKVMHGRKVGRTMGFPTVNLVPFKHKILPPNGIYLTKTYYDDKEYYSVTNIGNNPTFDGKSFTIETYIFDFNEDIYDKVVKIEFYKFLRGEIKFSSIDDLKNQIQQDINSAKKYYNL